MERDQVAAMADEIKPVAPSLVKAHAHSGQRIGGAELLRPHRVQGFGLQNLVAVQLPTIQKRLRKSSHIRRCR